MQSDNPNEILSNILKSNASADERTLEQKVVDQIKTVQDPEIPINVYDLGLIYAIKPIRNDDNSYNIEIEMTLTNPNCPVADTLPVMVQDAVKELPEVKDVTINIVFEPPWDMSMLSDEARFSLNLW